MVLSSVFFEIKQDPIDGPDNITLVYDGIGIAEGSYKSKAWVDFTLYDNEKETLRIDLGSHTPEKKYDLKNYILQMKYSTHGDLNVLLEKK